jgi:hypothetical protein
MVGDDVLGFGKPPGGELRQYLPLVGHQPQDAVEGGKAVGCDQDQAVGVAVDIAHLALRARTEKGYLNAGEGIGQRGL